MSGAKDFNQSAASQSGSKDEQATRRRHRSKPTDKPFSLRLSEQERAWLRAKARGGSIGAYIRKRVFTHEGAPTKPRRKRLAPARDHQLLAQLLGELGRQRLASNLNQLAKLANSGSLPVTPDTEAALRDACTALAEMRAILIQAMGLAPATADPTDEPDR